MKYKITKADRMRIVHEYETSDQTGAEIARKYGTKSASTISTWKNRLQNSKKIVSLQPVYRSVDNKEEK